MISLATTLLHVDEAVGWPLTSDGEPPSQERRRASAVKQSMARSGGPVAAKESRIRVLVAKPGLDGHDRGARVGARLLRDAGMEVIYTGLRQTTRQIAEAALQEDVDMIVLSILSGAHIPLAAKLMEELKMRGVNDVPVVIAGTIPDDDVAMLKSTGVAGVFSTGSPYAEVIEFVRRNAREHRTQ
jgi:methylmalonyl-CoA mutase C-terminal domain/subunit